MFASRFDVRYLLAAGGTRTTAYIENCFPVARARKAAPASMDDDVNIFNECQWSERNECEAISLLSRGVDSGGTGLSREAEF